MKTSEWKSPESHEVQRNTDLVPRRISLCYSGSVSKVPLRRKAADDALHIRNAQQEWMIGFAVGEQQPNVAHDKRVTQQHRQGVSVANYVACQVDWD